MSLYERDIQLYENSIEQLRQAVAGLTPEQLTRKPAPEAWSVTEVLSHLADHHIVISFRIREIISGSTARLPAFDQDAWVLHAQANESSAADILDFFEALVVYNRQLFRRIPAAFGEKSAVNARGQQVTLTEVIQAFADHLQTHLRQIARILSTDPAVAGPTNAS
ncbi:DinB superfamily metal-dependent hydrolase [Paenibacillus sp. 32O-W]|jgi:Protein of unknown function (DUF664).|uniref:DinB family protein n=1 Tax=Paenibacillus sp. 32O-W TaxID=1695218 RepID=UPI00071F6EF2|nr:DinB family protein [Paenibacillus sp. 32O-W]ALS26001.1 DinB superfamily metal-dependent hydrolase [Paenibacillus sp. 32O-W]